jgi:ATP-dependent Clp protease ATP-binding subunit ClpB
MDKLRDKFKPELLNRIDSVVIFDTLSKESLLKISDLMLKSLQKNLDRTRKIALEVSTPARLLICDKGYDEAYGARPLKRVIDKELRDPLANMIVSGSLVNGSVVRVDAENGKFVFQVLC